MNFLEEISSHITKEYGISIQDYRLVNLAGKCVYIEGHTGIQSLSEEEILLHLRKKTLSVKGDKLIVKYFDNNTIIIEGNIFQTSVFGSI